MRISKLVLSGLFCVGFMATASAGSLFPPDNMLASPGSECPNGTVLAWTGNSVICRDPTMGVTITCPDGSYMAKINQGEPTCISVGAEFMCPPGQSLQIVTTTTRGPGGRTLDSGTSEFVCKDVLASITQTCGSSQAMIGFKDGKPVCQSFCPEGEAP